MLDLKPLIALITVCMLLLFQPLWSEEVPLYEDKSISQITEMKLDVFHFETIFQNRLLNGRDESDVLKLLDGPDGIILNATISCLMHTKNHNGLIKIIKLIDKSSEKTRANIYAVIPYVDIPDWKGLIQDQVTKIKSDTESKYMPLREYSKTLLSYFNVH